MGRKMNIAVVSVLLAMFTIYLPGIPMTERELVGEELQQYMSYGMPFGYTDFMRWEGEPLPSSVEKHDISIRFMGYFVHNVAYVEIRINEPHMEYHPINFTIRALVIAYNSILFFAGILVISNLEGGTHRHQ